MASSVSKKVNNNINVATTQKILSPVPYGQGFHFFMTDGHYSGETAMSLAAFRRDLESVDIQSIRYHFYRGDFQKWIRITIGDEELAVRLDNLKARDETLQKQLVEVLQKRLLELHALKSDRT